MSIQFGQAKQGSTFIFAPSFRHCLSQGASFPNTARVPLSMRLLPLAFPKLTGTSLPDLSHCSFASWLQTLLFIHLFCTCVLLMLFLISGAAHLPSSWHCQEAGVSDRHVPTSKVHKKCAGLSRQLMMCKHCLAQPSYTCVSFWRWSFRQL